MGTFRGGLLADLSVAPNPNTYEGDAEIEFNGIVYAWDGAINVDNDILGASAVNEGYGPSPSIDDLIAGDFIAGSPVVGTNVNLSDLAGANVFAFVSFDNDNGNTAVLLARNMTTGLKGVFDGENVVGMTDRLDTDYASLLDGTLSISINGTDYDIPAGHWRIEIVTDPETIVPFLKDFVA